MTIKELHDIAGNQVKIFISWNGSINELDREDILMLTGYSNFLVMRINVLGPDELEAVIKAIPATI